MLEEDHTERTSSEESEISDAISRRLSEIEQIEGLKMNRKYREETIQRLRGKHRHETEGV